MPRIIGLTGNIACGKTSVGHMLLALGAERYIDAMPLCIRSTQWAAYRSASGGSFGQVWRQMVV